MKILTRGLALAVVGAGLAALPTIGVQAAPAAQADPDGIAVTKIRDAASGAVSIRRHPATDKVGFVRAEGATGDLLPGVAADGRQGAVDKAEAYLDRFAGALGARAGELAQTEVYADKAGWSVTFQQSYRGVPVFAGEVKAHVDREGDLTSVNGFAAPALSLDVTPRLSKAQASEEALAAVKAKPSGYEDGGPAGYRDGLKVRKAELTIYRTGSTRGIDGEARLAWAVEVWNKATIRESLILDAATGKPLNRWSMMAHALERHVYEAQQEAPYGYDRVWSEGEAFPGDMTEDQQNEALGASESYWLFRNTFGYNSWDGNSGPMYTINNDPRISCPNANWNGFSTNYCTGVTGDDTVAHEWGHAYTESTSGLIYQWQSGAMNEAYSDIWGETVDMLNERQNEGGETPDAPAYRTPGLCSDYTRSDITMEITAPSSVAGPCTAAPAAFGPTIGQTPVTGTAVVGVDGTGTLPDGTADTSTGNGCLAFTNASAIDGNWVYVDRGACTFGTKAANAEAAGAEGIVVGDNAAGRAPISMSGSADIYGVMVTLEDGAKFKSAGAPVSFTTKAVPADTDETYRWLSGESDPAFGGAIRDMWNPNCYGDPGKVSDAEYHCTSDDGGGVHSNSGVVNRTFALLVDGLDGQGTGIGLDKAAWLFWHTQSNYLTPASYFPDLADGLEASCDALTGVTIEKVTLGNPTRADGADGGVTSPEVVEGGMETADCDYLRDVIAETELRMDPTEQCDWQPLLAKEGMPALDCGEGTTVTTSFSEDFEDGLAGWTQDEELGYPTSTGRPWVASTDAPDHAGGVAFGPDPVEGDCDPQSDDITSRNGLISPAITVPAGDTPRFSFDHYVATEATWDGGNVKVSVDGGDFELVPADAYLFNAPGGELDSRQGPMGGEPAWTGTDGGQLKGSWGTSIIDLGAVASEGAAVKFRFDMGRDGCNGIDGWYVDNVKVEVCADAATTPPPTTPPTPAPTPTPTPTPPTPEPKADSTTTGKVSPKRPRFGHDFTVIGKVLTENRALRGRVIFRIDGKRIGSRKVREGRVVMTVRKNYGVGKHTLVVVYRGTDNVSRSKDKVKFRVRRR